MFCLYRLPVRFEEQVVIGDRFHVKPLLSLLHTGGRFFILTLSQETARLFEATRDSIHEIALPEIARAEVDGDETSLQLQSQRRGARPASDEAVYHGHGGGKDRKKSDALNYFHRVNDAVRQVLEDEEAPLVLACVGYLAPIYETANSYKHLINANIPGDPARWTDDELRDRAWKAVEPHFQQLQQSRLVAVREAASDDRVLSGLREAIVASGQGRIETMLLRRGEQRWGHVDIGLESVQVTNDDHNGVELLDYAAVETLNHGGNVFIVDELPGTDSPLVAIARY